MNEITKPNPELLGRLKDVYVSSSDPLPEISRKVDPRKPLPSERKSTHLEYNYVEPETRSPGFLSLLEAIQLLSQYQRDKKNNPVSKLAAEYNLKEKDVENVVEYFKLYTLVDSGQKSLGEANVSSYLVGESEESKNPLNVITAPEVMKKISEWKRGTPLFPKEEKDAKDNKSEEKK
ncbi:hypothetical protein ONE63_006380 [Megalurothrips usitatus]|nr:hypothetical protein ONE63_006380 [Megalurothrips usitatus]